MKVREFRQALHDNEKDSSESDYGNAQSQGNYGCQCFSIHEFVFIVIFTLIRPGIIDGYEERWDQYTPYLSNMLDSSDVSQRE